MSVTLWLIEHFSTPALVVLIVGGLMAFAGSGLILVRQRWPDFTAGEHNDVAGVLLGIVGAIYGIMLAFVVVALYTSFTDSGANVRDEASDVAQISLDTEGLGIADAMAGHVRDYLHDVVIDEWPRMATGESSAKVDADLHAMYQTLQGYVPRTDAELAFYNATITDINAVTASRRSRLYDAAEELPTVLQILLVGGALLLVSFTWLFGMRRFRTQLLMVLGVAMLVGFSLLVTILIDHPFSGDLTVSSAPFQEGALAIYW